MTDQDGGTGLGTVEAFAEPETLIFILSTSGQNGRLSRARTGGLPLIGGTTNWSLRWRWWLFNAAGLSVNCGISGGSG